MDAANRAVSRFVGVSRRWLDRPASSRTGDASPDGATEAAPWTMPAVPLAPLVSRTPAHSGKRKVVHFIGSLQPGGAERQLCNCAIGQHRLGFDVTVLVLWEPENEHNHFGDLLASAGVPVRVAGSVMAAGFVERMARIRNPKRVLGHVPGEFRPFALDVFGEVLVDEPDIFHAWLDHSNIWGGLGAYLAGAPLIVMSLRNVNPTHFSYLSTPYFRPMYQWFAMDERVRFINNSEAGAADYREWLGLPGERISVVRNGVDLSNLRPACGEALSAFREELGLRGGERVITGVFRLSEEKQPLLFLEVAKRLLERFEDLRFVVAGIGPLESEMRAFMSENGLDRRIHLLGRRTDVATIFSAATLTLLCSRQEGTPNVLLESQWLGCPVVSTRAGGAVDAVAHERSGLLVAVGDVNGLVAAATRLLEDEELRQRMVDFGHRFVEERFSVDRMIRETNDMY